VVTTSVFGLNAVWKPDRQVELTGDLYRSTADRPEGGADTFVTAGLVTNGPYPIDTLNLTDVPNSLPNINVVIPPSQLRTRGLPQGHREYDQSGFLLVHRAHELRISQQQQLLVDPLRRPQRLFGSRPGHRLHARRRYDVGSGWFDKVLFGAGYSDRDKSRYDISNDWTNGSGQYGTLYKRQGCPVQCSPYSFGSQGFDVISMVSLPNFMQGAGGSYPTVLPQLNAASCSHS
jgi:iron complex outermembrane recepter protein